MQTRAREKTPHPPHYDYPYYIPMGVTMRRVPFDNSGGRRPRCVVRPPINVPDQRHVTYDWCDQIGYWKRGEQHLCHFHAGIAAALDDIDSSVRTPWPNRDWQVDFVEVAKYLAEMQHYTTWRIKTLDRLLPGINLDGKWPTK